MNVIYICGGLGNQLFQYAFGRAQMENGIDVKYNLSWYKHPERKYPRPYRLDKFCTNVKASSFTSHKIFRECRKKEFLNLLKRDNCGFKGYWQRLSYSKDVLLILKKEFQVKKEFYTKQFLRLKEKIIINDSISIHVRRTDYLTPNGFGCLPFRYYFEAIKKIKGDIYIFSDDMLWCKSVFKKDYFLQKVTFVHLKDYLDFELMRLCKYNITANSSFSRLAAYLNDDSEKIVICPIHWLSKNFIEQDRYPKDWIKINY